MEYSYRYCRSMDSAFTDLLDCGNSIYDNLVSLSKNNALCRSLVLDLSTLKDSNFDIEIPVFIRNIFEKFVNLKLIFPTNNPEDIIVIPLYSNCNPCNKRTSDSIITDFYSRTPFDVRLKKVITNKGEVYYGNKGIIFNKDFIPILVHTIKIRKNSNGLLEYYQIALHVHPSVFLSTGLLEKSIIKKVIPYYITNNINYIVSNNFSCKLENRSPLILIDDMSSMISIPAKPSANCTEESFNNFLCENQEEIINMI